MAINSVWIAFKSMSGSKSKKAGSTSSVLRYIQGNRAIVAFLNVCFSAQRECTPTTSPCSAARTTASCCFTSRWWWDGFLPKTQTQDGVLLPIALLLLSLPAAPPARESAVSGRAARRASATTARQSGTPTRPATWLEPRDNHWEPARFPSRKTLVSREVALNWRSAPDAQSS